MQVLKHGERALPLAWRVEATEGPIGLGVQRDWLEALAPWLPEGVAVCLMADRFYGTADLISLCQVLGWGCRLRFKGNCGVGDRGRKTKTGALADNRIMALQNVQLTTSKATTNIGIMPGSGLAETWSVEPRGIARTARWRSPPDVALSDKTDSLTTLDCSKRWGIEPMFSDFKSRRFGVEHTQFQHLHRASPACRSSWRPPFSAPSQPACGMPSTFGSRQKTLEPATEEGRALQDRLVHPRPATRRQATLPLPQSGQRN